MGKIVLLDDSTVNKIAAGEVVERPAAVVKELIENAIDAGAAKIDIAVAGGGLASIRVADDGTGIAPEDVLLALQRHATSKISEASDLATVLTLGFRGEALPSIASVSRLILSTRQESALAGTLVEIHGGTIVRHGEHGCAAGTEVRVEDLFYNTPARLKFTKSEGAETARITDTVQRLALASPQISFSLSVNDRNVLTTAGNTQLFDVIHQVYGRANSRLFLPLKWQGPLLSVSGYISQPALARANRNMQSFFINRRHIRSPLLSDALQTAYQTLLPRNRFPAAVLFIEIDTTEVDINVHPSKREVRFSRERDVYRQVLAAAKQSLQASSLVTELSPVYSAYPARRQSEAAQFFPAKLFEHEQKQHAYHPVGGLSASQEQPTPELENFDLKEKDAFPLLQPVGRLSDGYILAQSENKDFYIIDQHAAHERILFEMFRQDVEGGNLPVQSIIPLKLELDAITAGALTAKQKIFADLGLNFEVFGNNTFILRTVPLFYRDFLSQDSIMELVSAAGKEHDRASVFEETLKMMACKSAAKANDTLSGEEMANLLKNLRSTHRPYTCPHGRPTVLVFTRAAVDSHFRRR
ncbi:MAG: DNA mismatch repair endonuclease MutL [Dethiobacter sp.]|jgi:DNA mismatch repair protein MutL|nr:DNA mismatch repair endonuclease MutL [Dethiobacter sp.]